MLCRLACVLTAVAALDGCINPCPRRQLMTYVAHTQGGGSAGVTVAARVDANDEWRLVGSVAAADASMLERATALQHRLIEEHGRRLFTELRTGPGGPLLELGLRIGETVTPVATPLKRDFVAASVMTRAGFVGIPKKATGSDVYANFREPYDAPYDRQQVRSEINDIVRQSPLVLFGWSTCWFCTDAEKKLKDAGLPFRSVYMDLWRPGGPYHDLELVDDGSLASRRAKNIRKACNPLQAELALLSGRCTVPVVVVRGTPLDGDEQHGSVVEALASGALERAVVDDSPWAPVWPTTGPVANEASASPPAAVADGAPATAPPPVVVMKRCRVCRQRYSDAENSAAACKHHPGTLRGESSRKVRRPRLVSSLDGVALVRLRAPSARPGVFDVHPRRPQGNWEGELGGLPSDDDLVWTYSCCGGDSKSPGCVVDQHRSYDD
jgi:glutaredoxin